MKTIIRVNNISKRYQIREKLPYYSLRDEIVKTIANPLKFFNRKNKEYIWALNSVSFKVNEGEVLGIIGQNGAGKSTLLKILSQITPPTKGEIRLRGRVASLLEVGTGVHPELTGRENIYLSGAILGMKRSEIKKKFNDIVDFSGVEKFIDTPVKHYSSGMQVRLGFSVAAHLETDILLVDEVLAVGDAEFQKKCLGKMDSVRKQGRTILFVSHNLATITSLCQRVVLLKGGKVVNEGKPEAVVTSYLTYGQGLLAEVECSDKFANKYLKLVKIRAHDNSNALGSFDIRRPIGIDIEYKINNIKVKTIANIQIKNSSGVLLFNSHENTSSGSTNGSGTYRSTCWIPGNFLAEGLFLVRVTLTTIKNRQMEEIDYSDAISFTVYDLGQAGAVKEPRATDYPGLLRPKLKWTRTKLKNLS